MSNTRFTTRRGVLKGIGAAGVVSTTGMIGSAAATGGRNKRFVLKPDFDGLQGGAVGTRNESYSLAGSWKTGVDTNGDGNDDKFALYLTPDDLFQNAGDVTVDDLTHVSYHTKKETETSGTNPYNVYLQIYTEQDGTNDGSWYGHRITAEPYFAQDLDAPGGEWIKWSTSDADNQLTFFDDAYVGYGFYGGGQPTLQELQAGSIDWSTRKSGAPSTNIDYGQETIRYITLQTGSGYPDSFAAFLDTVEIGVSTSAGKGKKGKGQTARIDLEA
ncbi:hypothetical protein [Halorubrum sp. N11]|uniref:hypothetical protein n=1 Tax=Halorubrum sp. N11 TaxID=3402276 RepID=UPI003EC02359